MKDWNVSNRVFESNFHLTLYVDKNKELKTRSLSQSKMVSLILNIKGSRT